MEPTTLEGAERSDTGLTAPRGNPRIIGQDRPSGRSRDVHEEARLTRDIYEAYRERHQKWMTEAFEDLEFYNGAHWTDEQREKLEERGQKAVQIQTTYQLVEQAVAMLTAQNPSFRATARESSDRSYADMVADLQQWIWQISDGQRKLKSVARDYYVRGLGYMYAYVDGNKDRGKGEVLLEDLDPFSVIPDPNSTHPLFDDAAHVLVRRVLTAEKIRAWWPNAPLQDVSEYNVDGYEVARERSASYDMDLLDVNGSQFHSHYEVIERFTKVDRPHWRVKNPVTGEETVFDKQEYRNFLDRDAYLVQTPEGRKPVIDQQEVQALDQVFDRFGETYHMQRQPPVRQGGRRIPGKPRPASGRAGGDPDAVPGSTRRLQPTTVGALVQQNMIQTRRFLQERIKVTATVGSNPGKLLYEPFDLPVSDYPVVPFPNTHNRNPYPISDVRRVKDLQELINKTNSLILAHAANATNQKVFYPRGSIQDPGYYEEKWAQAGSNMFPYDPAYGQNGGINVASPGQLPAELYKNQDRFITLMQQTLGIFSMQQGDAKDAPDTYQGTLALDEFGMRRIKSKKDDLEYSLERVGTVATRLSQRLYRPDKVIRLTQPNGETIEQKLGLPGAKQQQAQTKMNLRRFQDMMSTRYDVVIEGGSTLPNNRWSMLQQYMEMFQAGVIDDVAVLKQSDIPDAESILQRKSMYSRMQQNIQGLQKTVERLQKDLDTARSNEMRARKEKELTEFRSELEQIESDLNQMEEVYQQSLQKEQEKQQALMQKERQQRTQDTGTDTQRDTQSDSQ